MRRPTALPFVLLLVACGSAPDASDGAAVAACRDVLDELRLPSGYATTVSEADGGYRVRAWDDGQAEGEPDHLCDVALLDGLPEVTRVRSRGADGAYESSLDLEFDR